MKKSFHNIHHTFNFLPTSPNQDVGLVQAAFIVGDTIQKYKLPETTTILTGELIAIYKALCYIRTTAKDEYMIITDSLNAFNLIHQIYPRNPVLTLIKEGIHQLRNKQITFL